MKITLNNRSVAFHREDYVSQTVSPIATEIDG